MSLLWGDASLQDPWDAFLVQLSFYYHKCFRSSDYAPCFATSSGNFLCSMYAKYGCIHVTSIIMTYAGSISSPCGAVSAPESLACCVFCLLGPKVLAPCIARTAISSQKTSKGIGRHWDHMFASVSASSLLAQLTWDNSHPLKVPSR
jgi:hypothetical protein